MKILCLKYQNDFCLNRPSSLVLIDPHGDLAESVARQKQWQQENCPKLVYLDPTIDPSGKLPPLNPFTAFPSFPSQRQQDTYAQLLARTFTAMLKDGNQSLSLQMETLLIPCISVLLQKGDATFFDLYRFLFSKSNADLLTRANKSNNQGHRHFFENLFEEDAYKATRHSIATKIQSLLNHDTFARMISNTQSSLNLKQILDQ